MEAFHFIDLTCNATMIVPEQVAHTFDTQLLQAYIRGGGGPVPGYPDWSFRVEMSPEGAIFSVLRTAEPALIISMGGVAFTEEVADEMWESLEDTHLIMYETMVRSWRHNIPDECLGNPNQPTSYPWVGVIMLAGRLSKFMGERNWLAAFHVDLSTAILSLAQ